MTNRSPAAERVCEAAVSHFAVNGYDGASLNEIAAMVGIKKASLYSHFDGKDALFLQVLKNAVAIESAFAREAFATEMDAAAPGGAYIEAIGMRYETSVHLRYLLRTVYLPPVALKATIGSAYEAFLDLLCDGFRQKLEASSFATLVEIEGERYGRAYIGIVESLFVELTYAGLPQMEARRDAIWQVLLDSMILRASAPGLVQNA